MTLYIGVLAVFGYLNLSCQGQEYIVEDPGGGDFSFQQQQFSEPLIPYTHNTDLQRVGYQLDPYQPRDLETSDLPLHLQQTLLQYRQKIGPKENYQNRISNIPENPRPLQENVKPSTHKPNYSHELQNSLQFETIQQQKSSKDPLDLEFIMGNLHDNNNFDNGKDQKVIRSAVNLPTNLTLEKNSISEKYEHNDSLDLDYLKENPKENVQNTTNFDAEKNDTIEDDEFYSEPDPDKNSEESSNKIENQNYIDDEEYDEDYVEDEENNEDKDDYDVDETEEAKNETYEVLTMQPRVTTQENNFNGFVDIELMDTTTQEPASSEILTQLPVSMSFSPKNITKEENNDFPEYVVSVVTSKTIVNNTIISPVIITQPTTSSSIESSLTRRDDTTDSWIVVASVQTSKSISGARYLPSSIVEQHNVNKTLSEPDIRTQQFEPEITEKWSEETTTTETLPTISRLSTKFKTSTESLIDKLDRVQSDLSSGLLAGGFKNDNIAVIDENTPVKMDTITEVKPTSPSTTKVTSKQPYPQVNIRKFNAGNRSFKTKTKQNTPTLRNKSIFSTTTKPLLPDISKGQDPSNIFNKARPVDDLSALLPPGYSSPKPTSTERSISKILAQAKPVEDISALLPPGFKQSKQSSTERSISSILAQAKPVDDISNLLPPGFKIPKQSSAEKSVGILAKAKPVQDISDLLPPDFKSKQSSSEKSVSSILANARPVEDISALLPPGFKQRKYESNKPLGSSKNDDNKDGISSLLPKDYKTSKSNENNISTNISSLLPPDYESRKPVSGEKSVSSLLAKAVPVADISSLLPPGYRGPSGISTYNKGTSAPLEVISHSIPNNLLPPGYELKNINNKTSDALLPVTNNMNVNSPTAPTTSKPKEVKLVFPSRPGEGSRKNSRLTTPRPVNTVMNKPVSPTIQKGWPVRASTEFSGWPTPSTTPISIEKLLEAAKAATTSTSTGAPSTVASSTTTTKPTTTSPKSTTPGTCVGECDLAGTIKLVGGVHWVPELLDRNTKEYQILANEVQSELESIYSNSPTLKGWYRKIRIDGFSEGSVLVDYLVELNEVGKKVDTQEIKNLFHESLSEVTRNNSNREGKSLNETRSTNKVALGHFELDPKFTDFVVIPKNAYPTVSYAEDNILIPQWAIAVIVIGLASLLFVIIFGVTALVNRHKSAKKSPTPLTEDMLNELNKNHMGGLENYAVDDFYNLEDVWSDKPYEQKLHKKRTNDSIYDNSMSNLYDSWRSQWNGTYDNRHEGSLHSQLSGNVGSRRSKYDTNF